MTIEIKTYSKRKKKRKKITQVWWWCAAAAGRAGDWNGGWRQQWMKEGRIQDLGYKYGKQNCAEQWRNLSIACH